MLGAVQRLTLQPDPRSVARARDLIRTLCRQSGAASDLTDTAILLTSEAVTNAFMHGRSEARVVVTVSSRHVLVEVGDDNSRHPQPQDDDSDALDGRGMAVIDALAASWGVRDDALGKVVWFEVGDDVRV